MNKTAKYIFDTLARADITISDFALLLTGKISRQTLHHWKAGGKINDQLRLNLAFTTAKRLATATDTKKLPLTEKIPSAERVVVLKRIILGG
jgi:hypothetical protein